MNFKIFILLIMTNFIFSNGLTDSKLVDLLGDFPIYKNNQVKVIEEVKLSGGIRYKISFVAEGECRKFNRPTDVINAYLFVPNHNEKEKLPAIVAIHQDGNRNDLGKEEPAGINGDKNLFYGLELFKKGYVVIIPDRYPHGERRRLNNVNKRMPKMMQNLSAWMKWTGQLMLEGRTYIGKEVYDLIRTVDILETYDFVDKSKIGAIGHSAGGNILVYFMFCDKRIKAGVSSCGFFSMEDYYNEENTSFVNSIFAIKGLSEVGTSVDYLSGIAPRPILMTKGKFESGNQNEEAKKQSREHVRKAEIIEKSVAAKYSKLKENSKFKVIYFEGGHEFPKTVRKEAYEFLDDFLKK